MYNVKKGNSFHWGHNQWNSRQNNDFMESYVNNFDADNLDKSLSLNSFEVVSWDFSKIWSNSSLRKVFDSYLDTKYNNNYDNTRIQVWFAKIWYQEKRGQLPNGFLKFLSKIYEKLNKDNEKFRDFLEVFVAYHKYFNPKSK